MTESVEMIRDDVKTAMSAESVMQYQAWLHREEPTNPEKHEAERTSLEQEWWQRYENPRHKPLCTLPKYMTEDVSPSMWSGDVDKAAARLEAKDYNDRYFDDVQFVFSRVQHHIHRKTTNVRAIRCMQE